MSSLAVEIAPGVFLGPLSVAQDQTILQELGISHIISLCDWPHHAGLPGRRDQITYLERPLNDAEISLEFGADQIVSAVAPCVDFIRDAMATGNHLRSKVLIHGLDGRTRSAAVATCVRAVLVEEGFHEAYEALRMIKSDIDIPVPWHSRLNTAVSDFYQDFV